MDETLVIQKSVGALHVRNVSIDWAAYFEPFDCQRVLLPTYAFQRETFKPKTKANWFHSISQSPEVHEGVEKMMFEMNWRPIDTENVPPSRGVWGLLSPSEETAWTRAAQKALSNTGLQLVPVTKLQEAEQFDGVLSLWDSDNVEDVVQTAYSFIEKALAQLQEVVRADFAMPVVWVTRHTACSGPGDRPVQIGAGPLWGLMRTGRSENPQLRLRLIDVDDEGTITNLAKTLTLALMLNEDQTEIAVRKQQLLIPHLERASVAAPLPNLTPNPKPLLRTDGVVLVTGGLGDLGGFVARRLAGAHGIRDLVLTSRRGMESPGSQALVAELAKLGARTTIVGGDIADLESLRSIFQIFTADRPLRGVIHAAGVVDSGILSSLTPQKCATTFAPKVNGLWNLHQLTKDNHDIDIFIMFSSLAGVMGLPGLGNYAAANCFIDVLAHFRRAQGLPATSVAWGTWGGEGMVAKLVPATRAHLMQLGFDLIDPQVGLDLLEQAVHQGRAFTVAALLDLKRLKAYYENQGGIPAYLRSMLAQIDITNPEQEQVGRAVNANLSLRDMLLNAATEQYGSIVLHMVQKTIAKAVGYEGTEDLDASRPLDDFGIDSLIAVLIRKRLATMTGLKLPPNIALLHPTLKTLSKFLLSQLQLVELFDVASDGASSSGPEDDATPTTTTVSSSIAFPVNMSAIRRGLLDPSIQFNNVAKGLTASESPVTVFVTGATGFVGAFMVHECLTRGIKVCSLVRASSATQAQERMITTLKQYSLWKASYEALLQSVDGDLSLPLLGLREGVWDDLANRVDAIVHSGARVDWMRPLEEYVGPNILGTHEVLRLSSSGSRPKAVHYISTMSTLPYHLGYGLTEDDGEYGYGTSKYLAEKMIVAARFRGAKALSYRLPFVGASARNGHFRLDRGDFLNNLITGSLDLGAFPSIDANLSNLLPVDYLCNTIATIMSSDQQRVGEDYDFLNPQAPTFNHYFQLMGSGKATVPFGEWRRRAFEYAAIHPKSSLARITTIIDGFTDENAGDFMKPLPVGKHVFGLDQYPAPLLDEAYVKRYLDCILATKEAKTYT